MGTLLDIAEAVGTVVAADTAAAAGRKNHPVAAAEQRKGCLPCDLPFTKTL